MAETSTAVARPSERHLLALRDAVCDFGLLPSPVGVLSKTGFTLDVLAKLTLLVRRAHGAFSLAAFRSSSTPDNLPIALSAYDNGILVLYEHEWLHFARSACGFDNDGCALLYFNTFLCLLKALPDDLQLSSSYLCDFAKQQQSSKSCVPALGFLVFLHLQAAIDDHLVDDLKRGDEYPYWTSNITPASSIAVSTSSVGATTAEFMESVELVDANRRKLASFVRSHAEDLLFLLYLFYADETTLDTHSSSSNSISPNLTTSKSRRDGEHTNLKQVSNSPHITVRQLEVLHIFFQPVIIQPRDFTGVSKFYADEICEAKAVPLHCYLYCKILLRMNPLLPDYDSTISVAYHNIPLSEMKAVLLTDVKAYQPSYWALKTTEKGLVISARDQHQLQPLFRRSTPITSVASSPISSPRMSPSAQRKRPSLPCPTSPCLSPATSPPSSPLVGRSNRFSFPTYNTSSQQLHLQLQLSNQLESNININSGGRNQILLSSLRDPFYVFKRHVLISPPFAEATFTSHDPLNGTTTPTPSNQPSDLNTLSASIRARRSYSSPSPFNSFTTSSTPNFSALSSTPLSPSLGAPSNASASTTIPPPTNVVVHETFLAGQHVRIQQASHVAIYLLGPMMSLTIVDCHTCTIFVGAVQSFLHLQRCYNVRITAACGRYSLSQCANITSYLCCNSPVVLFDIDNRQQQQQLSQLPCDYTAGSSSSRSSTHRSATLSCVDYPCCASLHNLVFAPHNTDYPSLKLHLQQARLTTQKNFWDVMVPFWDPQNNALAIRSTCRLVGKTGNINLSSKSAGDLRMTTRVVEKDDKSIMTAESADYGGVKWGLMSANEFALQTLPVQGVVPINHLYSSLHLTHTIANEQHANYDANYKHTRFSYERLEHEVIRCLLGIKNESIYAPEIQQQVTGHPELTPLVTSFHATAVTSKDSMLNGLSQNSSPTTIPLVEREVMIPSLYHTSNNISPLQWATAYSLSKIASPDLLTVPLPPTFAAAVINQKYIFEQYRAELLKKPEAVQRQISSEIGETLFRWMESNGLVKELKGIQGMKKELEEMKRMATATLAARKMTDGAGMGVGLGLNEHYVMDVSTGGE